VTNEEDLFAQLEDVFAEVDADEDVINLNDLSNLDLLDMVQDITDELMQRQESLKPRSQEARDLHSLRNAAQVVMRSRGMQV
jgi:hypothetical protein